MSLGWLDNARGPIYPMIIDDLKLSHSEGSAFFALASLTSIVANLSVPFLLKFLNPKKLLLLGVVVLSFFPILLSISLDYRTLLFSAISFGWSLGTVMVTQNLVIEENVPLAKKRFFLSLLHSTYGLSALLSPLLVGLMLSYGVQWRFSFLYSLFFMFPVLCLGMLSLRLSPQQDMVLNKEVKFKEKHRFDFTFNKSFLLFWGVILACYVSAELFFTTRLVVILKETLGLSLESANISLALFFLGLFFGRILVSLAPNWCSGRMMLIVSFFISAVWVLFCYFFYPEYIWLAGIFMAPIYPVAMDEISNQTGKDFGHYSSMIIALSSMGVVFMHMIVGHIFDSYGMRTATLLPFFLYALSIVMCVAIWPNLKMMKAPLTELSVK